MERIPPMKRSEARKEVMSLCFEYAFKEGSDPEEIYALASEFRDFGNDGFIRECFLGIISHLEFIDEKIVKFSNGWNKNRISPVALAILRTAVYEIYFREDIPAPASINEAIEIIKEYDDAKKLKSFVNGILNAVLKEKEAAAES